MQPLKSVRDYRAGADALQESIVGWRADVVFASTLRSFTAIAAARQAGIPSIWSVRESEHWQTYFSYLPDAVARLALECFPTPYRVVFDSDACRSLFEALNSRHNFSVIHTGIAPDRCDRKGNPATRDHARDALGIGPNDVMFLLVGTICDRKGQEDLIAALPHISEDTAPCVQCFLVGDRRGEYSGRLTDAIGKLPPRLQSRVHVVAETQRVTRVLSGCGCVRLYISD